MSDCEVLEWLQLICVQDAERISGELFSLNISSVLQLVYDVDAQLAVKSNMTRISVKRFEKAIDEFANNIAMDLEVCGSDPLIVTEKTENEEMSTESTVADVICDDSDDGIDVDPLLETEKGASLGELREQLQLENQCVEQLNSLLVCAPVGKPKLKVSVRARMSTAKLTHQERATRLNHLVTLKLQDIAATATATSTTTVAIAGGNTGRNNIKKLCKKRQKVSFKVEEDFLIAQRLENTSEDLREQRKQEQLRLNGLQQGAAAEGSQQLDVWECRLCKMANSQPLYRCSACHAWRYMRTVPWLPVASSSMSMIDFIRAPYKAVSAGYKRVLGSSTVPLPSSKSPRTNVVVSSSSNVNCVSRDDVDVEDVDWNEDDDDQRTHTPYVPRSQSQLRPRPTAQYADSFVKVAADFKQKAAEVTATQCLEPQHNALITQHGHKPRGAMTLSAVTNQSQPQSLHATVNKRTPVVSRKQRTASAHGYYKSAPHVAAASIPFVVNGTATADARPQSILQQQWNWDDNRSISGSYFYPDTGLTRQQQWQPQVPQTQITMDTSDDASSLPTSTSADSFLASIAALFDECDSISESDFPCVDHNPQQKHTDQGDTTHGDTSDMSQPLSTPRDPPGHTLQETTQQHQSPSTCYDDPWWQSINTNATPTECSDIARDRRNCSDYSFQQDYCLSNSYKHRKQTAYEKSKLPIRVGGKQIGVMNSIEESTTSAVKDEYVHRGSWSTCID